MTAEMTMASKRMTAEMTFGRYIRPKARHRAACLIPNEGGELRIDQLA